MMWPGVITREWAFWMITLTPRPDKRPTPVGVTSPSRFGSTKVVEGHGMVLVVTVPSASLLITVSTRHGSDHGDAPSGTKPIPGYSCPSNVVRLLAYTGATLPRRGVFLAPLGAAKYALGV